jgi:hypothetical protein
MWATRSPEFGGSESNQENHLQEPYYFGRELEFFICESCKRQEVRTGVIVIPYYMLPDCFEFRSA